MDELLNQNETDLSLLAAELNDDASANTGLEDLGSFAAPSSENTDASEDEEKKVESPSDEYLKMFSGSFSKAFVLVPPTGYQFKAEKEKQDARDKELERLANLKKI